MKPKYGGQLLLGSPSSQRDRAREIKIERGVQGDIKEKESVRVCKIE